MQSSFKIASLSLLTDVDGVEAGLAVVGLVDGGDGDDDADEHRQHSRAHEHQSASPAAWIRKRNLSFYGDCFTFLALLKVTQYRKEVVPSGQKVQK